MGIPLILFGVYALTLPGGATDAKVIFLLLPGIVIFLLGALFGTSSLGKRNRDYLNVQKREIFNGEPLRDEM